LKLFLFLRISDSLNEIIEGFCCILEIMYLQNVYSTTQLSIVSVWYKKNIFHTIMPVSYGLTHTARVGSVMATLSVTLERFFAIVFPFKDVEVVKRWLLPCAVTFTVTYNIPKFFEVSILLTILHCFS
jgi:hypothetical protein